jgi:hypothetical protein
MRYLPAFGRSKAASSERTPPTTVCNPQRLTPSDTTVAEPEVQHPTQSGDEVPPQTVTSPNTITHKSVFILASD